MELNKVLARVHKLIALSEGTIPADATEEERANMEREQKLAAEQADALMTKYAIDQAALDMARPAAMRTKPDTLDFAVGDGEMAGWLTTLAGYVASHCRCLVRNYVSHKDGAWHSRAYGYESDLRYFEILWTTLRLHMLGAIRPSADPALSLDDNCYQLHEAGFNWLEIAKQYGWSKCRSDSGRIRREHERGCISDDLFGKYEAGKCEIWYQEATDTYDTNFHVGGIFKRAYMRAVKARGEQPTKLSASGSKTFRYSAAQGYVSRLVRRLREVEKGRDGTATLALRIDDLEDFYRESNPKAFTRCPKCEKLSADPYDCDRCGHKIAKAPEVKASRGRRAAFREAPFSEAGYRRGARHADTADLGGPKAGSAAKRELS
jgi:hypothetical protein